MKPWPWTSKTEPQTTPTSTAHSTPSSYGGGSITGSVGTFYRKKECVHTGKVPLFAVTIADRRFTFAGARGPELLKDGAPPEDTVLVVDLAGMADLTPPAPPKPYYEPWVSAAPALFRQLEMEKPPEPPPAKPLPIDVVRLLWRDQDAPPPHVTQEWWQRFLQLLPQQYPQGGHVIVCCVGSHGRTGTALAAINLASCATRTVAEVGEFIRKHHCKNSIEDKRQWNYLASFRPDETLPQWIEDERKTTQYHGINSYGGYQLKGPAGFVSK